MSITERIRCPRCNVKWQDVDGESTGNLVGHEILGNYDGVCEWHCKKCKSNWCRWTEELIYDGLTNTTLVEKKGYRGPPR